MSALTPTLHPTRYRPNERRRLGAPGLRAFGHIAGLWGLSETERLLILGSPARSTYYSWLKSTEPVLPVDTLTRISAALGIHKALRILFDTEAEGVAWLRGPHAALPFAGQPPVALVTSGSLDGLMQVRRFLDAARGGIYMPPDAAPPWRDEDIVIA